MSYIVSTCPHSRKDLCACPYGRKDLYTCPTAARFPATHPSWRSRGSPGSTRSTGGRPQHQRTRTEGALFRSTPVGQTNTDAQREQLYYVRDDKQLHRMFQFWCQCPSGFWRAGVNAQRLTLAFFFKLETLRRILVRPATPVIRSCRQI